jgi:ABC-type glycerol-3-phosphate transport system substrate-binding protein
MPDRLFAWGRAAMTEISAWSFERWQSLPFRVTLVPPPRRDRAASLLLANGIAVNRTTPHLAECRALVDFLLSPPVQEFLQLDGYGLPAFSGTDALALAASEHAAVLRAVLPHARVLEPAEVVVMETIGELLTMALGGALEPRTAVEQMQRAAAERLAQT